MNDSECLALTAEARLIGLIRSNELGVEGGGADSQKNRIKGIALSRRTVQFVGSTVWPTITSYLKKGKIRRVAAVAYLNTRAFELLPLRKGDTLVVNDSALALKTGATNPHEIEKFKKKGVRCYGNEDLHAKLFVSDNYIVVGSANASSNSKNNLIEACLTVKSRDMAEEAEAWIFSLQLIPIDANRLKDMKKEYRVPKFWKKTRTKKRSAATARTWVTWVKGDAPEPDTEEFESKYEEAKAQQGSGDEEIGWISQGGKRLSRLFSSVSPGDQVIIIDHSYKKGRVYAPVRALAKPSLHQVDGRNKRYLFVEAYGDEFIALSAFRAALQKCNVSIPVSGKSNKQIRSFAGLTKLWSDSSP